MVHAETNAFQTENLVFGAESRKRFGEQTKNNLVNLESKFITFVFLVLSCTKIVEAVVKSYVLCASLMLAASGSRDQSNRRKRADSSAELRRFDVRNDMI